MSEVTVFWFSPSCMRVHDNAAFANACSNSSAVIPIYIGTKSLTQQHSGTKLTDRLECEAIQRLHEQLSARGSKLLHYTGRAADVAQSIEDLSIAAKATQLITSDVESPQFARLLESVTEGLRSADVAVHVVPSGFLREKQPLKGMTLQSYASVVRKYLPYAPLLPDVPRIEPSDAAAYPKFKEWKGPSEEGVSPSPYSLKGPLEDVLASTPTATCRAFIMGLPPMLRNAVQSLGFGGGSLKEAAAKQARDSANAILREWLFPAAKSTELWGWRALPRGRDWERGMDRERSSTSCSSSTSVDLESAVSSSQEGKEPDDHVQGSRMLALLRHGVVSPVELVEAAKALYGTEGGKRQDGKGGLPRASNSVLLMYAEALTLYSLYSEYAARLVAAYPSLACEPARLILKDLPWCSSSSLGEPVSDSKEEDTGLAARLKGLPNSSVALAFYEGRTGYPLIDAGIHCLRTTGWLPFQYYRLLSVFWTRYLLCPMDALVHLLSEMCVDMSASAAAVTAQLSIGTMIDPSFPYVAPHESINPASERTMETLFETGVHAYVRHWLPRVASLPNTYLLRPWRGSPSQTAALPAVYTKPIVTQHDARNQWLEVAMKVFKANASDNKEQQVHGVTAQEALPSPDADELRLTARERMWGVTGSFPLLVEEDVEILLSEENIDDAEGWKLVNHDKKRKLKVWMAKATHHKTVVAKAILEDISVEQAFTAIANTSAYASWDRTWAQINDFGRVNRDNDLLYLLADTPPAPFSAVVTQRDFCQVRNMVCYPNEGLYVVVWRNAEYPSAISKKKSVRGETMGVIGFIVRRLSATTTEVVFSTSADMKGRIPQFLVNFVAARTPKKWVDRLRAYCNNQKKQAGTGVFLSHYCLSTLCDPNAY